MRLPCGCYIVPRSVLDRFAHDSTLPPESRKSFVDTRKLEPAWRKLRAAHTVATQTRFAVKAPIELTPDPAVSVYDCGSSTSLPGLQVDLATTSDPTAKRAGDESAAVAKFYKECFGRNSIDDMGMTLVSSVHYDQNYNNAYWDGSQMVYGDGDGNIFIDFTNSNDVIGHELTHGVTQNTAGLTYEDEPGGLNESISDVFGSMYRQWKGQQDVTQADWLIGAGIMGPAAKDRGFTCLRDMANPGDPHCLSQQPGSYDGYVPGGDPHINSGIPNHAFCLFATSVGGKSWEKAGKVWYAALTDPKATKTMKFRAFAELTLKAAKTLFPDDSSVYDAANLAWQTVGVLADAKVAKAKTKSKAPAEVV